MNALLKQQNLKEQKDMLERKRIVSKKLNQGRYEHIHQKQNDLSGQNTSKISAISETIFTIDAISIYIYAIYNSIFAISRIYKILMHT